MTIFVVGGGTGGHLFPAIALGEELTRLKQRVFLITDTRCKGYIGPNFNLQTYVLSLGYMRSGLISKMLMTFRIFMATIRSIFILRKNQASLVVGFGGYPAFPTLLAAKILCIPIMLHEQNCFFGKVNNFFAKTAVSIALNFAETRNVPDGCAHKIIVSGNPVRPEMHIAEVLRSFVSDNALKILVIGGSQGAKVFSSLVPEAMVYLKRKKPELQISITQQATTSEHVKLSDTYTNNGIAYELQEFFHDMPRRYLGSDLVICRSGASTISELIHLGQPAILIPFPFAAEDHQFFNASALVNKSAAWCFRQYDLTPEILADKIIEIISNPNNLSAVSKNLLNLRVESERILADTVMRIIST
jgi:UDP-N-acetylglucosamine--N-acetylmuramyl-(pentapeptide) pyrophosphoryl-undecaprenol N-acetylglucosamine transferase